VHEDDVVRCRGGKHSFAGQRRRCAARAEGAQQERLQSNSQTQMFQVRGSFDRGHHSRRPRKRSCDSQSQTGDARGWSGRGSNYTSFGSLDRNWEQKLRFDRPESWYAVSKGRYPVEGADQPCSPAAAQLVWSLSIRRSAAATRSRARSKSATVYCRGPGRVRFLRDPFDALLARMTAVSFFAAAIWSLRFSERTTPIKHIQRGFASRAAVILGMHGV
jgi:hypothetical protein